VVHEEGRRDDHLHIGGGHARVGAEMDATLGDIAGEFASAANQPLRQVFRIAGVGEPM
jgi:hypothetical protein